MQNFDEVLICTEDEISKVRRHYEMDRSKIDESVEILKKWIGQQRHLPQNQDDDFLERCLLRNKFRLERTKEKLEAYYTLRGLYRDIFYPKNAKIYIPSKESATVVPMPFLTQNLERICIATIDDPLTFDYANGYKFITLIGEILMRYDYSIGEKIILDYRNTTIDMMRKVPISETLKMIKICQEGYSGRTVSIEIVNANHLMSMILGATKLFLPSKLHSKLKVHGDYEALRASCPPSCLPKDYGGSLDTLSEIKGRWDRVFDSYGEIFEKRYAEVSDESLRVGPLKKNDNFGVDGTFKKLNLD